MCVCVGAETRVEELRIDKNLSRALTRGSIKGSRLGSFWVRSFISSMVLHVEESVCVCVCRHQQKELCTTNQIIEEKERDGQLNAIWFSRAVSPM